MQVTLCTINLAISEGAPCKPEGESLNNYIILHKMHNQSLDPVPANHDAITTTNCNQEDKRKIILDNSQNYQEGTEDQNL